MSKDTAGRILYYSQGEADDLHYCIVEYRELDPYELIKDLIVDLGIVFLCLDGDKLEGKNKGRYQKVLKKANVPVTLERGNLWLGKKEACIYFNGKPPIIQGNEFIFSAVAPISEIRPISNPLKGWYKNKLEERVVAALKATLGNVDIYVHDDFTECLFVSKNKDVINSIKHKVELFGNMNVDTT